MGFSLNGFECKSPGSHMLSLAFCELVLQWAALFAWLPREGTTCVLSFTVNRPGEFLWSVSCFIVVWALHICETQIFPLPINTDTEQVDVFMTRLWHVQMVESWGWITESLVLCPSLLLSQSVLSQHMDEHQTTVDMVLGQPSELCMWYSHFYWHRYWCDQFYCSFYILFPSWIWTF